METKIKISYLSITTILTFIFLVLKLCSVITWSWWLVFLPLIIEMFFQVALFVLIIILKIKY